MDDRHAALQGCIESLPRRPAESRLRARQRLQRLLSGPRCTNGYLRRVYSRIRRHDGGRACLMAVKLRQDYSGKPNSPTWSIHEQSAGYSQRRLRTRRVVNDHVDLDVRNTNSSN